MQTLSVMLVHFWADERLTKAVGPGPTGSHGCLTAETVSFWKLLRREDHRYSKTAPCFPKHET